MITCTDVQFVLQVYGDTPRHELPEWLRNPDVDNDDQFALAVTLAARHKGAGIEPLCKDGILVGLRGIGPGPKWQGRFKKHRGT